MSTILTMNQVTSNSLLDIEEEYRYYNEIHERLASYVIDEFDEDLKSMSGTCINIECGLGNVTNNILLPALDSKATLIGTDVSNRAIEYAKKTYINQARLNFEILNIESKNLPEKYISKFDHIFLFNAMDWSMDQKQVFMNIYRMLRPSGTMLVVLPTSNCILELFKIITTQDDRFPLYGKVMSNEVLPLFYSGLPLFYSLNPRKEVKGLLKNLKYEVHHCSHREFIFTYNTNSITNNEYIFLAIKIFLDFFNEIPPNLQEELMIKYNDEQLKRQNVYMGPNKELLLDIFKILITFAQKRVL